MSSPSQRTGRLFGKVAIITGGASGYGEAMVMRFAEEGARIVIADLDTTRAKAVAAAVEAQGGEALAVQTDVTSGPSVAALAAATLACFGKLDICVNNAGLAQPYGKVTEVEEALFDRLVAVNLKSLYWAAIKIVPMLQANGGGVIINTSSASAVRPRPGTTWYNASKAAVVTATKTMAAELAADNIRACAICPVAGETPLFNAAMAGFGDAAEIARRKQQFAAGIPLGRLCSPSDVANAAVYLASDEAAFITGIALDVDGGRSI
jgi:3-oxoacyl-[acyl-carrier protein] reductase